MQTLRFLPKIIVLSAVLFSFSCSFEPEIIRKDDWELVFVPQYGEGINVIPTH